MYCKSLWIKASGKCNDELFQLKWIVLLYVQLYTFIEFDLMLIVLS